MLLVDQLLKNNRRLIKCDMHLKLAHFAEGTIHAIVNNKYLEMNTFTP